MWLWSSANSYIENWWGFHTSSSSSSSIYLSMFSTIIYQLESWSIIISDLMKNLDRKPRRIGVAGKISFTELSTIYFFVPGIFPTITIESPLRSNQTSHEIHGASTQPTSPVPCATQLSGPHRPEYIYTGWWLWFLPLWKMMDWKSVGMMTWTQYDGKNHPNVPNHQRVLYN